MAQVVGVPSAADLIMCTTFACSLRRAVATTLESVGLSPVEVVDIWAAPARDRHATYVSFTGPAAGFLEFIVSTTALEAIAAARPATLSSSAPEPTRRALDEVACLVVDAFGRELGISARPVIHAEGAGAARRSDVGALVAHVRFISSPGCIDACLRLAHPKKWRDASGS